MIIPSLSFPLPDVCEPPPPEPYALPVPVIPPVATPPFPPEPKYEAPPFPYDLDRTLALPPLAFEPSPPETLIHTGGFVKIVDES